MRKANLDLTEFPLAILDYSLGNYCRLLFQRYMQKVVRVTLIFKGVFNDFRKRGHERGQYVCLWTIIIPCYLTENQNCRVFAWWPLSCLDENQGKTLWGPLHCLTKIFVWLRACMTAQILVAVLTLSCASRKVKCINYYIWCNDRTAVLVASSMLKACPAARIVFHSRFTLLHCHASHKVSFAYTKGHRMLTNQNPSKINCCPGAEQWKVGRSPSISFPFSFTFWAPVAGAHGLHRDSWSDIHF